MSKWSRPAVRVNKIISGAIFRMELMVFFAAPSKPDLLE